VRISAAKNAHEVLHDLVQNHPKTAPYAGSMPFSA